MLEETQEQPNGLPNLRGWSWDSKQAKQLQFAGKVQKESTAQEEKDRDL